MAGRMPDFPLDVVAFDLDGTLADTAPDLAAALNHVLAGLGRPRVDPEKVRHLVGDGARALLRRALGEDEEEVERALPLYLDYYAANICVGTRLYPGVERALDGLAARGARLAICTNKRERMAHLLIEALGWRGRFAAIVGADTLAVRKPDPAPLVEAVARAGGAKNTRRAAFVGDSIIDAETARAAGVPFVAVSFGFSDRPVEALRADAVIDSYDALIETLAQF
jgi:phosphoglycolate phosphatase